MKKDEHVVFEYETKELNLEEFAPETEVEVTDITKKTEKKSGKKQFIVIGAVVLVMYALVDGKSLANSADYSRLSLEGEEHVLAMSQVIGLISKLAAANIGNLRNLGAGGLKLSLDVCGQLIEGGGTLHVKNDQCVVLSHNLYFSKMSCFRKKRRQRMHLF